MELYLPPIIKSKKPKFIPYNKGKSWDEYLPKQTQDKILKNLNRTGRSDIGGWNANKIVAIKDGKFLGCFTGSIEAGEKLNLLPRLIRRVVQGKRKTTGGIMFFLEEDDSWTEFIYEKYK